MAPTLSILFYITVLTMFSIRCRIWCVSEEMCTCLLCTGRLHGHIVKTSFAIYRLITGYESSEDEYMVKEE